jgi:3'-5' exoribonuclease
VKVTIDSSGAAPPLTPRSFCRVVPWPLIRELSDGDEVVACFLVHEARRAEAKNSKPYLRLTLGDASGTIDAFVWDEVERWEPFCVVDSVVGVRGRVGSFQERLQLKVHSVDSLHVEAGDLELLLQASPRPRGEMEAELDALLDSPRDAGLRRLLHRCLGRSTELGRLFRVHPAAKRNHHGYVSGLMEHSLSVAGACERLVAHYRTQGVELDRDLLLAGALLHDLGKVRELRPPPASGYTTEGRLLGHIVMGIQMIAREAETVQELTEDRLLLLQHLIASHQGRPEWDSPRTPQLLEALVLHYADDLDAKMNAAGQLLSRVQPGDWSAYDRSFGRSFFRPSDRNTSRNEADDDAGAEPAFDLFWDRPGGL